MCDDLCVNTIKGMNWWYPFRFAIQLRSVWRIFLWFYMHLISWSINLYQRTSVNSVPLLWLKIDIKMTRLINEILLAYIQNIIVDQFSKLLLTFMYGVIYQINGNVGWIAEWHYCEI